MRGGCALGKTTVTRRWYGCASMNSFRFGMFVGGLEEVESLAEGEFDVGDRGG